MRSPGSQITSAKASSTGSQPASRCSRSLRGKAAIRVFVAGARLIDGTKCARRLERTLRGDMRKSVHEDQDPLRSLAYGTRRVFSAYRSDASPTRRSRSREQPGNGGSRFRAGYYRCQGEEVLIRMILVSVRAICTLTHRARPGPGSTSQTDRCPRCDDGSPIVAWSAGHWAFPQVIGGAI